MLEKILSKINVYGTPRRTPSQERGKSTGRGDAITSKEQ
jgi:hypothetical protein